MTPARVAPQKDVPTQRYHRILLAFIVLFGFFARASTYKAPLFDHHAWRQADTASISRNFFRDRFNILYPQVDQRANSDEGYVETGLEVFAFAVAAIARIGGFHTETGRLLSAMLFIVSAILLWRFVRHRYDDDAALVAVFLHAFAFPLLLFIERAFMNEGLLICLSLACLVAAQSYLASQRPLSFVALLVASSLIAAIKLPYLIIWAPVAGLFLEAKRSGVWRRWELWALAAINLAVAAAWYTHAHRLATQTGLSFGLTDKLFDPQTVFSLEFPYRLLDRMIRDVLEPVGLVAVTVGAWLAVRHQRWCEVLGLAGFAAYVIIVAVGNMQHDYYQLALMPIASVTAAPAILWMAGRFGHTNDRRVAAAAWILSVAALCTFVRLVSAHSWFEYSLDDVVMCEAIQRESRVEDKLLFIGDNNPQMLFCADRKGWLLAPAESSRPRIRQARVAGARLAVVTRSLERPDAVQAIADAGPPILANSTMQVYRLPEMPTALSTEK